MRLVDIVLLFETVLLYSLAVCCCFKDFPFVCFAVDEPYLWCSICMISCLLIWLVDAVLLVSCVCFIFGWQLGLCFDFALLCFASLAFALPCASFLLSSLCFIHRNFASCCFGSHYATFLRFLTFVGCGHVGLGVVFFFMDLLLCPRLATVFYHLCFDSHYRVRHCWLSCVVLSFCLCVCVCVCVCLRVSERACVALHAFLGPGVVSP